MEDKIVIRSLTKISYLLAILGDDLHFEPVSAHNGQVYFVVSGSELVRQSLDIYDNAFVYEKDEAYVDLVAYTKASKEIRKIIKEIKDR